MRSFIAGLLCLVTLTALDAQIFRRGYAQQPGRTTFAPPQPQYYYPPAPQPQPQPQPQASKLDKKVDGHVGYNSGEVADMPQDTDKLCMVMVLADDWQNGQNERAKACRMMKSWLENEPRLIKYRQESRFSFLTDSDPAFRGLRTLADKTSTSLYAKYGDAFPIFGIEKPDGELIFKCSALSLPPNAGTMGDRVTYALKSQEKKAPFAEGMQAITPFVFEGGAEDCGPDGCPPTNTPVKPAPDKSEVLTDTPPPILGGNYGGLAVLGAFGAVAAGLGYVAYKRPGIKP